MLKSSSYSGPWQSTVPYVRNTGFKVCGFLSIRTYVNCQNTIFFLAKPYPIYSGPWVHNESQSTSDEVPKGESRPNY